jgi:alkylation response protein AidB-like acyl-CoA dehydrogenase
MDFTPDPADEAIVEVATKALTAPDTFAELARSGLLGLAVPARLGGDGQGVAAVMTLLTEVGRQADRGPALATLALGVLPVLRWGTPHQQSALLDGLATAPVVLTAALREPSDPLPARPATTATRTSTGYAVTGVAVGVPHADQARCVLVPVSVASGGTGVALVRPDAPGVALAGGAGGFTVRLDGAAADGLLGNSADGRALADLYRLALVGAAHVGAGAMAGALSLTSGHVATREQFGRPLAAFQAVAQQIADVYVVARTLRLAARSAAWRLDTDRPADDDVAVAAYWLASQAPPAVRTCHHLHGGLGLDVTYPLHRYSALITELVRSVGGPQSCLDRLSRGVGGV